MELRLRERLEEEEERGGDRESEKGIGPQAPIHKEDGTAIVSCGNRGGKMMIDQENASILGLTS